LKPSSLLSGNNWVNSSFLYRWQIATGTLSMELHTQVHVAVLAHGTVDDGIQHGFTSFRVKCKDPAPGGTGVG
jgi:hypothetical protein